MRFGYSVIFVRAMCVCRLLPFREDARLKHHVERLNRLKDASPCASKNVHIVSNVTGSGLNDFRTELLKTVINSIKTIGINASGKVSPLSAGLLMLHTELVKIRDDGELLLTWEEFREMALDERFEMRNEVQLFNDVKALIDVVSDAIKEYLFIFVQHIGSVFCLTVFTAVRNHH